MAYPFAKMPTRNEFVEKAKEHGCSVMEMAVPQHDNGGFTKERLLMKEQRVGTLAVPILGRGDEVLDPAMVRHLCRRLEIAPSVFGLTLDD